MKRPFHDLSKREQQILKVIYDLGQASVSEVVDRIPDNPGYSTIRKLLSILEQKTRGNLTGEEESLLHQVLFDLRMRYTRKASAK